MRLLELLRTSIASVIGQVRVVHGLEALNEISMKTEPSRESISDVVQCSEIPQTSAGRTEPSPIPPVTTASPRVNRNVALEFVRIAATIMVFLGHLTGMHSLRTIVGPALFLFVYGHEAVIAFFLLSGVVNRNSIDRTQPTWRELIAARSMRLLPLYLTVVLACVGLQTWDDGIFPTEKLIGHLTFVATLQGDVIQPFSVNPALWSMSFEFFFYLLLTLSVAVGRRGVYVVWFVGGLLALIVSESYCLTGWAAWNAKMWGYSLAWLLGFYLPEIQSGIRFPQWTVAALLGALPAYTNLGLRREQPLWVVVTSCLLCPLFIEIIAANKAALNKHRVLGGVLGTTAVIMILGSLWLSGQPLRRTIPLTLCACLFPVLSGLFLRGFASVFANRKNLIILGGRASYATYLVHMPIIFVAGTLNVSAVTGVALIVAATSLSVFVLEWGLQPCITRALIAPRRYGTLRRTPSR